MTAAIVTALFERDLNRLIAELNSYKDEESLWVIKDGISNSAGNLCLHLIGNLNHYIGATLGNTDYVRERDKEFSLKNIPRAEMISDLQKTISIIQRTLPKLSAEDLDKNYPIEVFDKPLTTGFLLAHLTTHLTYHLGQINYHRRLLT